MLESLSSNPICDSGSPLGGFTYLSFVSVPLPPSAATRWVLGRDAAALGKEEEVSQKTDGTGSPGTQSPPFTMSPPSPRLESGATQMRTLGGGH